MIMRGMRVWLNSTLLDWWFGCLFLLTGLEVAVEVAVDGSVFGMSEDDHWCLFRGFDGILFNNVSGVVCLDCYCCYFSMSWVASDRELQLMGVCLVWETMIDDDCLAGLHW